MTRDLNNNNKNKNNKTKQNKTNQQTKAQKIISIETNGGICD